MLLSDTLHLVGYNIFDRRRIEEERKLEKKSTGIFKPELKHAKSLYEKDDSEQKSSNNPRFKSKPSVDSNKPASMKLPTAFSPFKTRELEEKTLVGKVTSST